MQSNIYVLLLSAVIGFLISEVAAGRASKGRKQIFPSLRFKRGGNSIHIHHWVWCLTLLIIFSVVQYTHPILIGILLGACIQGLTYKDSLQFVYKDHA